MLKFKSGLNPDLRQETKTVVVSAMLETTGQIRFGDGTEINLTVTEKDLIPIPGSESGVKDGVEKVVFAGSKRRGVDRRTVHELRDRFWHTTECYVPELCGRCPTCVLFGFTGTTRPADDQLSKTDQEVLGRVNCKSRILYSTAYSIEPANQAVAEHSRNQVNERTQTTAGSAGIHSEEVIVGGVHFPVRTTLYQVLDWEIGSFAHAFFENLNLGRYTASSRAQGGLKIADDNGTPLIVVDVSETSVFPLPAPQVPSAESDYLRAKEVFKKARALTNSRELVTQFNLDVEGNEEEFRIKNGEKVLATRYTGDKAQSFLRRMQTEFLKFLESVNGDEFSKGVLDYYKGLRDGSSNEGSASNE